MGNEEQVKKQVRRNQVSGMVGRPRVAAGQLGVEGSKTLVES